MGATWDYVEQNKIEDHTMTLDFHCLQINSLGCSDFGFSHSNVKKYKNK